MTDSTNRQEHVAPMEAWDAIARGYDLHVARRERDVASVALRLAGLDAGDDFLDVAAGTGGLALPAARMGARVLATDWSPKMIERFEANVREQGIADARGRVMDCHALELDDDRFDVTGSQFGVMLVADQAVALAEMVRVTKPGGRVVLVALGDPAEFEALQMFVATLREVDPGFEGLPDDPPPLEFQVSDPAELERRLRSAGLRDVTVDTSHRERIEVRSGRDLWNWCLGSNPIPGMLVSGLDEAEKERFVERLDLKIRERSDERGIAVLTAAINIGVGTK